MRIVFTALLIALFISQGAFAYGKTGHRTVAEIATHYLTAEAAHEIHEILGQEFMSEASTWPDEMRSNPSEFWRRHASVLHYVNFKDGETYATSEKNPRGDAVTALAKFSAKIKDIAASKEDKALALRFIIHIIGDLHQPLHAGRKEDRGGNSVKVKWFGKKSNLHRVWDSQLIDGEQLSAFEWARNLRNKITPVQVTEWQAVGVEGWLDENAELRKSIYDIGDGNFSYDYVYQHRGLVKSQMAKGGVRLAGYLNALFAA